MTNSEKIKATFPFMKVGFITESQVGVYFVKKISIVLLYLV